MGNGRFIDNRGNALFWPLWHSMCMPLLLIHVIGSAYMVADMSQDPDAGMQTIFMSKDMIKLLPLKCYARNVHKSHTHPIHSLSLNIARLHKLLRSFLAERIWQSGLLGFLRANLKASTVIRFQLELEKSMGSRETLIRTLSE
uniref:Uncharacterized protein LOC105130079 isoform X2 n=1 Tax=Rhizophora mucronata TaxID=61149 RepID=A0A2P2IH17_RHIMU